MFTGIIETTGTVRTIEPRGDLTRLGIEMVAIASEVAIGDSVAVNGTCLTVTGAQGSVVHFDAVVETLEKTALADLVAGSLVNLERALVAGGRLDGHIVQGHVDGVGRIRSLERAGNDVRLAVDCPDEIRQFLLAKGSVAIDGVSLTVVDVDDAGFDVALIPLTLEHTTLGERSVGERVNLEADVLGKYVKSYLDRVVPAR
ncbi:MAG: riboflavin synthase [Deltaproteobacteria bacterium]|nr:riboflavin synthase [Deltaproteobacteria bacterium]MBW2398828.1 riboflavin synthase [Deltaproteobacteria bacterium]